MRLLWRGVRYGCADCCGDGGLKGFSNVRALGWLRGRAQAVMGSAMKYTCSGSETTSVYVVCDWPTTQVYFIYLTYADYSAFLPSFLSLFLK